MGRGNKLQSKADQIRAIVRLVKNETIYILVGQQGSAFCQINGVRIFSSFCTAVVLLFVVEDEVLAKAFRPQPSYRRYSLFMEFEK